MDTMITPEMHAMVGKEYQSLTSFPITASDIRRWAMLVEGTATVLLAVHRERRFE